VVLSMGEEFGPQLLVASETCGFRRNRTASRSARSLKKFCFRLLRFGYLHKVPKKGAVDEKDVWDC
jgi:hypothetical protein